MAFTNSAAFKKGRVGEDSVRRLMDWAGVHTAMNESDRHAILKTHDIRCSLYGIPFSIESKYDSMQAQTGNIAVEYHNPVTDKPSGIMATTSDLWAIVLEPGEIWICRTDDLRNFFASEKYVRQIKRAGDGNASIRLFKSEHLLSSCCKRIDNISPWDVLDVLVNLLGKKFELARNKAVGNSMKIVATSHSKF